MKKLYFLCMIFLIPLSGYSQYTFQRTYMPGSSYSGSSVVQTLDGGYAVCGDLFLMKTNSMGDSLWSKLFPGSYFISDLDHVFRQTADGGFIICGNMFQDILLIRTDSNGDTLWTRRFGNGLGKSVDITPDEGYIIACDINSKSSLIKTDRDGNIEWTRTFTINTLGYPSPGSTSTNVMSTPEGEIYLTGRCDEGFFTMAWENSFFIKISSTGDSLWGKIYSNQYPNICAVYSFDRLPDKGFILAGYCFFQVKQTSGTDYGILIRTDSVGNELWRSFTSDTIAMFRSVLSSETGNIFAAGASSHTESFGLGSGLLENHDLTGDTLWSKNYPAEKSLFFSLSFSSDGGYILSGYSYDNDGVHLVKTDALGVVYPYGIEDQPATPGIMIYPNPTSGIFTLKTEFPIQSVKVMSSIGSQIQTLKGKHSPGELKVDLTGQPNGIYLVEVYSDKGKIVKKIILEK